MAILAPGEAEVHRPDPSLSPHCHEAGSVGICHLILISFTFPTESSRRLECACGEVEGDQNTSSSASSITVDRHHARDSAYACGAIAIGYHVWELTDQLG